jgi:hypothetical protein
MMVLMTREKFRTCVFERDNNKCVICGNDGVDAHHIIERRLWKDGGYYLCNGATLCSSCHIKAEQTLISVEEIREAANIESIILPDHLYNDSSIKYDKWGNIILTNGNRLIGELFFDESVQKILYQVLDKFTPYVKYPRTFHVPWSQVGRNDDKYLSDMSHFERKRVIVTEKMDGENTTLYNGFIHARSINSGSHPSRNWVKGFWGKMNWEIPDRWRICGENLFARHTVAYENLQSYFLGFSIWNEKNECLDWDQTLQYFDILDIEPVPVLYDGIYDEDLLKRMKPDGIKSEGWIVRLADSFLYKDFKWSVAKYIGKDFVIPHGKWSCGNIVENGLKSE